MLPLTNSLVILLWAVVGERYPGSNGSLEVVVNGELIHSKLGGQGYVDSEEKLQRIFDAIDAALAKEGSA